MIEGQVSNQERHQEEKGLTLEELEGQIAEVLPNRIEMRHHRRRIVFINIKQCGSIINSPGVINNFC
jgi:protein involved in polysaccharide export with SLBB domain